MILALETSTATGGAALLDGDRLLASVHFTSPALHAQRLLPSVEWLLDHVGRSVTDIRALAVAIGPGSFTGLRIGLSAAKALAYANNAPLFGISTLEALALRAAGASPSSLPVCTLLDARQGEVYAALFQSSPPETPSEPGAPLPLPSLSRLREDYAGPLDQFLEESVTSPTLFAGDGAWKYRDRLRDQLGSRFLLAPSIRNLPSAEEIAWLASRRLARGDQDDLFLLAPEYLRRSYTQRQKPA